ncbi:DUF389 domain-containing protein [Sphingomonas sp. RS6]
MNEAAASPIVRPSAPDPLNRVPLYRWWRINVIDSVDHSRVMERIIDESGLSARYVFMTMMSAGIAVLGLLLSSPAVVIGAMLISPLMGPILGLGFALALFDFAELRRAGTAFAIGSAVAVLFTALIVVFSPLKAPTAEILARTRPNLFDLLVALFAALAGTFAIIRGRGDTIVGVAIATALMPPLAVVGYGLATWNMAVLGGSLALFVTNFLTIALAATIMARIYGFGHFLSSQQSWTQTAVLLLAFVAMSVPLAYSLGQIAREAFLVNQIRSALTERFGPNARITQLDVDFDRDPWAVRSVVIAPRDRARSPRALRSDLEKALQHRLTLQVDQILIDPNQGTEAQREALARANAAAADGRDVAQEIARIVAVAAGVSSDNVTVDRDHQRVVASAAPLPGAGLASYRALEARAAASAPGWVVNLVPPTLPLPAITFEDGSDTLSPAAREAVELSAWAAKRWNIRSLVVPGLPDERPADDAVADAPLAVRRALAIDAVLREQGVPDVAAPSEGDRFTLAPAPTGSDETP